MNFIESCRERKRELLNYYIDHNLDFNIGIEFNKVVLQNEKDIMEWLYTIDHRIVLTIKPDTVLELVKRDHYDALEWIQEKSTTIQDVIWSVIKLLFRDEEITLLDRLAKQLPCVDKLLSLRMISVVIELVQRNQLELLKWFHNHIPNVMYTFQNYQLYNIAFENGHEELLDWLVALEPKPLYYYKYSPVFEKACIAGNLKLAKLLYLSYPVSLSQQGKKIAKECSLNGRLSVLEWMYGIYKEYDYEICFLNACQNGHLSILEWILKVEHIDKKTILDGFAKACRNNDTGTITFLFGHCHLSLTTRNILIHISDLINRQNDTVAIDIILDNIYLRNELEEIFMVFYKEIAISLHMLTRYADMALDYSFLFNYYACKKEYELCSILVRDHCSTIRLTNSQVINLVTEVIHNMDHYRATEILQLVYQIDKTYFDPLRDTLFTNACYRNEILLAGWFVEKFPEHYLIVQNESGQIIESYILKTLPRSGKFNCILVESCSICMTENSNIVTNCHHQYCYSCINQWYNKNTTCPLCRTQLTHCFSIAS